MPGHAGFCNTLARHAQCWPVHPLANTARTHSCKASAKHAHSAPHTTQLSYRAAPTTDEHTMNVEKGDIMCVRKNTHARADKAHRFA